MRILPYRTSDDRIDGVVLSFVDITSRRDAERNLKSSDERFRLLIESAVDYAIFTMTPAGMVDSWNAGAERMFGYPPDGIVGRSAATSVHAGGSRQRRVRRGTALRPARRARVGRALSPAPGRQPPVLQRRDDPARRRRRARLRQNRARPDAASAKPKSR